MVVGHIEPRIENSACPRNLFLAHLDCFRVGGHRETLLKSWTRQIGVPQLVLVTDNWDA
jgi:hypothetical protein